MKVHAVISGYGVRSALLIAEIPIELLLWISPLFISIGSPPNNEYFASHCWSGIPRLKLPSCSIGDLN